MCSFSVGSNGAVGERPYKCPECGLEYMWRGSLKRHLCTHSGESRFKCRKDGQKFSTILELRKHVQMYHPNDWPFRCSVCGKIWQRACELKVHMSHHMSDRPYLCADCGKTFSDVSQLRSHAHMHGDDRPHFCQFCEKRFVHSGSLYEHVRRFHGHQMIATTN